MLFEEGMLTGCVYTELRGERGYFGLLAVDPQRQRSGIGTRLIAAAEQYCCSAGCRFMDLTFVNVRQEATMPVPEIEQQFQNATDAIMLRYLTDSKFRKPN